MSEFRIKLENQEKQGISMIIYVENDWYEPEKNGV